MWQTQFFTLAIRGNSMLRKHLAKNILRLGWGVYDIAHSPVDGEEHEGLLQLKSITPFLDFLCNIPPHLWHKLTQFRSEIFRGTHLCSAVHVNDRITHFCIIWCAVSFPYLLMPHKYILKTFLEGLFITVQRTWIFTQKNETMVRLFSKSFFSL